MAQKYGKSLEDIHGKTGYDVIVDTTAVEQRMKGEVHQVEILGQIFYTDLKRQSL